MAFHMLSLLNSAPMIVYKILTCQLIFYSPFLVDSTKNFFNMRFLCLLTSLPLTLLEYQGRVGWGDPHWGIQMGWVSVLDVAFWICILKLNHQPSKSGDRCWQLWHPWIHGVHWLSWNATRSHLSRRSLGPALCFFFFQGGRFGGNILDEQKHLKFGEGPNFLMEILPISPTFAVFYRRL